MMNTGDVKFERSRKGDLSGWCRVDSPVDLFESAALFRKDKVRICKAGSKITAAVAEGVFIKCYFYHTLFNQIRHKFRKSRAKSAAFCALAIQKAGVPTPAPWGFFREYGIFLPIRDYLFTDVLSQDTVFVPQLIRSAPEDTARRVVDCVAKLHSCGIEHGDLSLRNLYDADSGKIGVIDLDGCQIRKAPLCGKVRLREMARVISSAAKYNPDISLAEFKTMFLKFYKVCSGIDLSSAELDSRVNYLYNRRRA